MTKPQEYREECVVMHETEYQVDEGAPKGTHAASGLLSTGRVVWVQNASEVPNNLTVSAYAEGIGIVALDAHCLQS